MIEQEFEYNYDGPSVIESVNNKKSVLFSHCTEVEEDKEVSCFFYGSIINSFITAKCLSTLAKTVRSHFSLTPDQQFFLRDPIVSAGNQRLYFEGFSSCNSVYARVEILENTIDGEFLASGCTNVDFNDGTVKALNGLGRTEKLILGIGRKELYINTGKEAIIEKKVSLPDRWIKGLGNVQLYLSRSEYKFALNKLQAIKLFQGIPKAPVKSEYYLINQSGQFLFSPISKGDCIQIGGLHRLRLLEGLLPFIKEMSFYKDLEDQSFSIILQCEHINMLFTFSASVYRGFSGEGKHLENLIAHIPDEWIMGINHLFKTNEVFNSTLLAIESDISFNTMEQLSASLSSIGLLGFDLQSGGHFYRRLPFKLNRLKSLNPRIQNAQKLLDKNDVRILQRDSQFVEAEVTGSASLSYKVVIVKGEPKCTCAWYTSHQIKRGLCKHILAVRMKMESENNK